MDVVINTDCFLPLNTPAHIKGLNHYYLNIFKCLGYSGHEFPIADWLRLYHGFEGQWLVVSPVFWQATHNDAMILACDRHLNCSEEALLNLYEIFSDFAAEEGMLTHCHDPYTWLLRCESKPLLTSPPPQILLHQSIFHYLTELDHTSFWQRFLTEIQMLFSGVAQASYVNGVWIWGGGRLGSISNRCIQVTHQQQYEMACLLSDHVVYYSNAPRVEKNALLLFDSPSLEEMTFLSNQIKHDDVNWYWNNVAYHSRRSSWFSWYFS